jgi:tRNA-splicing ligase RtcB
MDLNVITSVHEEERPAADPTVFDSAEAPAEPAILHQLSSDLEHVDLAAPPVVLPDFHHKSSMEMPSSLAVATLDTIRPRLTSASVNCGMALIALDIDPPPSGAIHRFFEGVRGRFPHPPGWRRGLTYSEVLRAAAEGAHFAVDRFGLDPEGLERIEEEGRLDVDRFGGVDRLRRELPWLSLQLSRIRFGTVGPSNHFVELQQVEEVFDAPVAGRLGLAQGQMTIQYHAGGGVLAGQIGRLFVRRKKMSKPIKLQMALQKPLFHLKSPGSLRQLRERLALYFRDGDAGVPRDSREGERMMLGNAAAMNYGFAFRGATYAGLCAEAGKTFGAGTDRLIVDSPHNSIYEEHVEGQSAVVHRHNSCRAYPASKMPPGTAFGEVGQAVLVPGTNRTSSYVCVGVEGAQRSLYSACHGAGTLIQEFEQRGDSAPDPAGRETLRFSYSGMEPARVPQLDDAGVNAAIRILSDNRLVRPVARLRPVAVLT